MSKYSKNKIYLGSIPGNLTEEDIVDYFRPLANLQEIILVGCPENPKLNKGYAFLSFETKAECDALLAREHVMAGRKVKLEKLEKGQRLKKKRSNLF